MENFNLSDEEQRKFSEYFSALDIDKQAKLSFKCVRHFLSAYRLGEDDLEKVRLERYPQERFGLRRAR